MCTGNLPEPFGIDKRDFSLCFSQPSLRHFVMLVVGWVLTVGQHTISRVILGVGAHEKGAFRKPVPILVEGRLELGLSELDGVPDYSSDVLG